jgi:Molybdopterin converting factor, large subunit
MAAIRVQTEDFDAGLEIRKVCDGNAKIGAVASFVGLVRDINDESVVAGMTLEHYPGMTEKALDAIVEEAKGRWEILDCTVIHRVGMLMPTDQIVLVIVASSHRGHAFEACEFIMDFLKTRAPFWKKEQTTSGERWVEAHEGDDVAASRWQPRS